MPAVPGVKLALRGWGLRIDSSLPVPGAQPAGDDSSPEFEIELGAASLPAGGETLGPYRLHEGSLLFTMPGLARFLVHAGGTRLTVEAEAAAGAEPVCAMLIATALPAMLWMRGELLLHAAAAVPAEGERAIAFAGRSGSGKSTLLRGLVEAGAHAVADDSLGVQLHFDGSVEVSGLPGSIGQRRVSAAGTALEPERTRLAVAPERQRGRAELGALIVIGEDSRGAGDRLPVRLHGGDALAALLRHLHRPLVPRLLGRTAALLPRLARLAEAVPVYLWSPQEKSPGSPLTGLKLPPGWADQASRERHGGRL